MDGPEHRGMVLVLPKLTREEQELLREFVFEQDSLGIDPPPTASQIHAEGQYCQLLLALGIEPYGIVVAALIAHDHAIRLRHGPRKVLIATLPLVDRKEVRSMNVLKVGYPADLRDANVAPDGCPGKEHVRTMFAEQSRQIQPRQRRPAALAHNGGRNPAQLAVKREGCCSGKVGHMHAGRKPANLPVIRNVVV